MQNALEDIDGRADWRNGRQRRSIHAHPLIGEADRQEKFPRCSRRPAHETQFPQPCNLPGAFTGDARLIVVRRRSLISNLDPATLSMRVARPESGRVRSEDPRNPLRYLVDSTEGCRKHEPALYVDTLDMLVVPDSNVNFY